MRVTKQVRPLNPDNPTMDDNYFFAASYNDCTGLTPTVAHNEYEAGSYEDLGHYLPPVIPTAETDTPGQSFIRTEGIHAEVNTLDKDFESPEGQEGNHRLTNTHLYDK